MDNHEVDHIIYQQIASYLVGDLPVSEAQELEKWVDASEDNAAIFARCKMIWLESQMEHFEDNEFVNVDVQAAWDKVQKTIVKEEPKQVFLYQFMRIAAILLVLFGITFLVMRQSPSGDGEVVRSHNLPVSVDLVDGSNVTINKESMLTYSDEFGEKERKVTLKGQAFFNITRDTTKPFVIEANEIEIKVLGTSFDVNAASHDSVVVEVETGVVSLMYKKAQLVLEKGETGVYYRQSGTFKKRIDPISINQFWRNRKLNFKRAPLSEVISTLNQLYEVHIEVNDSVYLNREINVRFEDEDIETILDVLANTMDLKIEKSSDKEFVLQNGSN